MWGGYCYGADTGLFYVGSRYYDPTTGRFVNADDTDTLTATPMGLTDKNLFAYCDNNPVMRADDGGDYWLEIALGCVCIVVVSALVIALAPVFATGAAVSVLHSGHTKLEQLQHF